MTRVPLSVSAAPRRQIWIAALVACLLRLAYVLWYPQYPLCPDCQVYDRLATNIVSGVGLVGGTSDDPVFAVIDQGAQTPEVGFGPVYPAFLAAIYSTVGHRIGAVRIVQVVLGALIVPLAWHVAASAFGNPTGVVCAWLVAVSPPLVTYTGMLLTENLTIACLLVSTSLFIGAVRSGTRWSFACAGVALGTLILLREEMILLLPAFAGVAWWRGRPRPSSARLAAFVLAALVCVGIWTVRNYVALGRPILISVHGGEQLWISAKGWSEWHFDDPDLRRLATGRSYVERNAAMQRDALRIIAASPARYLMFCFQRLPMLWVSSHTTYIRGLTESFGSYFLRGAYVRLAAKTCLFGIHLALLLMGAWGAFLARRASASPMAAWMLAAPILAITAVHFILFATPRYQVPVLPFVLAFSALAVTRGWRGGGAVEPTWAARGNDS
ncbi:MAG: glycosyltransferase family 39 protein [Acidobacteria bacterium]|nr:glycosyltransferase family 39 protein [Acidobacteriota bacterium]